MVGRPIRKTKRPTVKAGEPPGTVSSKKQTTEATLLRLTGTFIRN
jgi:hypothetical protein